MSINRRIVRLESRRFPEGINCRLVYGNDGAFRDEVCGVVIKGRPDTIGRQDGEAEADFVLRVARRYPDLNIYTVVKDNLLADLFTVSLEDIVRRPGFVDWAQASISAGNLITDTDDARMLANVHFDASQAQLALDAAKADEFLTAAHHWGKALFGFGAEQVA